MAVGDGRFGLVRLVGQKIVVGISNWFYVVFGSLLALTPNFIQIGRKTHKLKIFTIGRFWLVRLVGQKMVVGISNWFYVVFGPLLAPIQKNFARSNPARSKTALDRLFLKVPTFCPFSYLNDLGSFDHGSIEIPARSFHFFDPVTVSTTASIEFLTLVTSWKSWRWRRRRTGF